MPGVFQPTDEDPPIADKPFARGQIREYRGRSVFTMASGQRCTVDAWRVRCAECERYFQTTAFHGHDPKPAPLLCRRCNLAKRERAVTVAERARPAAIAKRANAAEQRLRAARLAEHGLAQRERIVAERERAIAAADAERRRLDAKAAAVREREARRVADPVRAAKRAAHVAGVFEGLARAAEASHDGDPFNGAVRAVYASWLAYRREAAGPERSRFLNRLAAVREAANWAQRADLDDHLRQAYLAFKDLEAVEAESGLLS